MGEGAVVEIDLMDEEYAIPGELAAYAPQHRRIEAHPERTDRRIDALERRVRQVEYDLYGPMPLKVAHERAALLEDRVRHLETALHRLLDAGAEGAS